MRVRRNDRTSLKWQTKYNASYLSDLKSIDPIELATIMHYVVVVLNADPAIAVAVVYIAIIDNCAQLL